MKNSFTDKFIYTKYGTHSGSLGTIQLVMMDIGIR